MVDVNNFFQRIEETSQHQRNSMFPFSLALRLKYGLMIAAAVASMCTACSLGTKPMACIIPPPLKVNEYRMVCTIYFDNCDGSSLDVTYSVVYSSATSCECHNKTTYNNSISCTVPELLDADNECSFVPPLQFQYVFTVTEGRKNNVSYCVDPRNSVVSMAADSPPPYATMHSRDEVDLHWNVRAPQDAQCIFRIANYNAPVHLPWCLSYIAVQYRYRLKYKVEGDADAAWQVRELSCGACYYENNCSVALCRTRLNSLHAGFRYDLQLERAPHPYAPINDQTTLRTCMDGFAARSTVTFSFKTNDSVPSAGVVIDSSGYTIAVRAGRCNDQRPLNGNSCRCRQVTAYWREVPLLKRGGAITSYKVVVNTSSSPSEEFEIVGSAQNFSHCHCANSNVSISIRPATAEGPGNDTTVSKLSIPREEAIKPVDDIVVRKLNASAVVLSWRWKFEGHASFVAFWCPSFEYNCQDINWKHLYHVERHRGTDRYHTILQSANLQAQEFAIGALSGHQAMGFTLPACVYSQPRSQPPTLSLLVNVLQPKGARNEPALLAQWRPLSCTEAGGLLIAYHLVVCSSHGRRTCLEHRVPPNTSDFEVRALHPGTRYSISLKAFVHNGTHIIHSASSSVEDVLTTGLNEAVIAGIAAGAIFGTSVMLIGIVCCGRWLRGLVRTMRQSIVVPTIRSSRPGDGDNDVYTSCQGAYLLPRDSPGDEPAQSPTDADVRVWKVDSDLAFEGMQQWNSSYPELNSGAFCTDDYPLLNSPASLAALATADEAAASGFSIVSSASVTPGLAH